ncbi:MAG: hypothetical protein EBU92_15085 [Betaproteobacteria bacterium]|nr:hypothetical protein [Betaproteobacteria bacterium]
MESTNYLTALGNENPKKIEELKEIPGWLYIYNWDPYLRNKLIQQKRDENIKREKQTQSSIIYQNMNKIVRSWESRIKRETNLYGDTDYEKIYDKMDKMNDEYDYEDEVEDDSIEVDEEYE